ncbi:SNF-related serine/threonine-protein kinase [Daktulosphaira vitifoliae]|uniref:SNF-related serine/threonine-protein kinase n=1 Tax=Daktulosphaira vitifoliae TaxID=58002 RepID=UPI0021A9CCE2|nr:SNF-related serine/threonine-protein kinase [Daktulosphaira vitifoliae]
MQHSSGVIGKHETIKTAKHNGGNIAGLYNLEQTLGKGHFAVVKSARHVFTGAQVAVKVIDKTKLEEVSRNHLYQEVRCMKLVQHPNVVRLYEVIDTQSKLYIILELADGGDLYDYIMKHDGGLSEKLACEYFAQIVRAISYCHKLHVVHRDLKPENVVFFEKEGVVKLTDFGFSNTFCPGQKLQTSCGSLAYSAPEILIGNSYNATAVDIWSLGVILYMLVCGEAPFHSANDSETLTMIMDCKYKVSSHVSEECKNLIGQMLVRNPDKRATLEEIAANVWLKNAQSYDDESPLVTKQLISEEDHALIIQKMITGKIASKEEIIEALDKNEYNHITATYYLLAERKLASTTQNKSHTSKNTNIPNFKIDNCNGTNASDNVNVKPTSAVFETLLPDHPKRTRKCSVVEEEDEAENEDEDGNSQTRRASRSESKLSSVVSEIQRLIEPITEFQEYNTAPTPLIINKTPSHYTSSQHMSQMLPDDKHRVGNYITYEQRRTKMHKNRTASCSSSETSDDDTDGRKKRGSSKSLASFKGNDRDPDGDGMGNSGGQGSEPSLDQDENNREGDSNYTNKAEKSNGNNSVPGKRHCMNATSRSRRGRSAETRLRESQSLNRITEVQESEINTSNLVYATNHFIYNTKTEKDTSNSVKTESIKSSISSMPQQKKVQPSKHTSLLSKYLNLQKKLCTQILFGKKSTDNQLYKAKSCSEMVSSNTVVREVSVDRY